MSTTNQRELAIITGSSRGYGKAILEQFVQWKVERSEVPVDLIVTARNEKSLNKVFKCEL